jgi:DNA-binding response OmpR family regulator
MRILILEDSDSIRHMIEALVTARGHEAIAVPNGAKGIDAAITRPPDAILIDMRLQGAVDAIAVCRKLREADATRYVPIIVISALNDDASRQQAFEAGATAYYTRPFSPTALLKEIDSIPGRHSARLKLST